jgi:hypothetical protein
MQAEVIAGIAGQDTEPVGDLFAMQLAAYGLMQGDTTEEAAIRAGVSERTVFRWKRRPEFRELLATYQAEALGEARRRLVGLTRKAVDTIDKVLADASVKGAPTQLAAALGVLDRAGVEITATQAEGIRRIVSRMPERDREQLTITNDAAAVSAQVAEAAPPRQPVRIVTRGGGR